MVHKETHRDKHRYIRVIIPILKLRICHLFLCINVKDLVRHNTLLPLSPCSDKKIISNNLLHMTKTDLYILEKKGVIKAVCGTNSLYNFS